MTASKPVLVALNGSPRQGGACGQVLKAVLDRLQGFRIKRLEIRHLAISPCRACNACLDNDYTCWQDDDMPEVINLLDRAAMLVVAAPVYFYGYPAQVKALIDRCHPLWHNPAWQQRPKRAGYFISTCESPQLKAFDVIIKETKAFFNTTAFQLKDVLLLPGTKVPFRLQTNPQVLKQIEAWSSTIRAAL
jgi:multimeric flavodoxin WrbA